MENREIRFNRGTGRPAPWLARALRVALLALLAWGLLGDSFATGCEGVLSGEVVLGGVVRVRGREPTRQSLPNTTASELLIFAREQGVDVTLEVTDSKGRLVARGDNPIRRTGVQRALLTVKYGEHYEIVLTGKERDDSNGSVELQVIDLHRAVNSKCLAAQKLLARADSAYADGEAVTHADVSSPGANSDKSYHDAANGYQQASVDLEVSGPSPLLAQSQLAEASILNLNLDSYPDAKHWATRAAHTFAVLRDDYGKARAQATAGAAATDVAISVKKAGTTNAAIQASAILAQARADLDEAVAYHAAHKELHDQAWAQNYIGVTFYYEGRYDEAMRAYQKSLPLYEQLHESAAKAQVLQNLALAEAEIGRVSDAIPHFREALDLIRRAGNPTLLARALGNSAQANLESGNEDVALRELSESLALARTTQDLFQQSIDLHHMASAYARLGDNTRALDFDRQALALFNTIQYVRGQTAALKSIANILREQGHAEEALKMDRETLALETTPWARPRISVQIAKDLLELGRPTEASEVLNGVLNQNADIDEIVRARALQERAGLRASTNDLAGAETDLRAALATFKTYDLLLDEFTNWIAQARLRYQRGATGEAFTAIDQALALAEEVRLYSANPELRSTLLQPLRPAFDLKISMLFEQYVAAKGRPDAQSQLAMRALQTAEQARARALSDYQAIDTVAAGLDPALLAHRKSLYRELAARRSALEESLDRTGTDDNRSRAIRSEIASLRQEVDQIDAQIGAASQSNSSREPFPRKTTSLQLSSIPAGVAIVEYWLGTKNSFAWVAKRDGLTMTSIGQSARINTQAIALHTALRSFGSVPKSERLEAGERLYLLVLAPIAGEISGIHTLIFALDGALHYVPFAALRYSAADRKLFLVQNYDIAVTPSLQLFLQPNATRTRTLSSKQMLLVDDPVYDPSDPRVAHSTQPSRVPDPNSAGPSLALMRGAPSMGYLPRLPGAAKEATAIASLLPPNSIDRLEGFSANREQFLKSELGQYRLIHVASHATTDSEIPQASALILSTVDTSGHPIDGRVLGADFLAVRLHADTVVLSACDTALGKSVAGEGLIGLQYAVLSRGARSVVSSLWPAMDQVTAELMVKFYSALLDQHSTVIAAWSAASRAALQGLYSDPGTWGAFMLTLSHVDDLNTN